MPKHSHSHSHHENQVMFTYNGIIVMLKAFVLVGSILAFTILKQYSSTSGSNVFNYMVMFSISSAVLSVIGFIDKNLLNNIAVGLGLSIGLHLINNFSDMNVMTFSNIGNV